MRGRIAAMLCGLTAMALAGTAHAIPVDLELSLVIDSSTSIDAGEFAQQATGYANAFRQAPVVDSIVNAPNGIAVNTILFATTATEVIGFTHLQTAAEVAAFADQLEAIARISGSTNIAGGIDLALETIALNAFDSGNIVIDVSGDGEQNVAGDPAASRDAALSAGVSRINGLAIGGVGIFDFYSANVVGGTGSFVRQADSFDEFGIAIAEKVRAEVGAPPPPPPPPPPLDVPEPSALGLVGLAVLAMGLALRRRRIC